MNHIKPYLPENLHVKALLHAVSDIDEAKSASMEKFASMKKIRKGISKKEQLRIHDRDTLLLFVSARIVKSFRLVSFQSSPLFVSFLRLSSFVCMCVPFRGAVALSHFPSPTSCASKGWRLGWGIGRFLDSVSSVIVADGLFLLVFVAVPVFSADDEGIGSIAISARSTGGRRTVLALVTQMACRMPMVEEMNRPRPAAKVP